MIQTGAKFAALLFALLCAVAPITAQNNPPYTGLDIVFLVDQSGSMGGEQFGQEGREPADPLGLRFEAIQYALSTLGEFRLSLASQLDVQMAVVAFGDEAPVVLDWTPIADQAQAVAWDTRRTELLDDLSVDTFRALFPDGNLGNTNFSAAFDQAQRLFSGLPDEQHLRVIVLLTDGEPCVVSGDLAFRCGDPVGEQDHMDGIIAFTQAEFPAPDYLLYVIALDATGALWRERQVDWETLVREADRAQVAESSSDVGGQFLNILTDIAAIVSGVEEFGAVLLPEGETVIPVQPYIRELRLTLFKTSTAPGNIAIVMPDGTALNAQSPSVRVENQDRAIEIWHIDMPQPGDWRFTVAAGDQLEAFLQTIPIGVNVTSVSQEYQLYNTARLSFQVTDENGSPLPEYPPPYRLRLTAIIAQPDGQSVEVALTESQTGTYESDFLLSQMGIYRLSVRGTTEFPAGTEIVLVEAADVVQFEISGLEFTLSELPAAEYLSGQTYSAIVTLRGVDGTLLQLPDLRVAVTLTDDTGAATETTLTDAQGSGEYPINLVLEQAGTFRLGVQAFSGTTPIGTITSDPFRVTPSERLNLIIDSPAPQATVYTQADFPTFAPTDLVIDFTVRQVSDGGLLPLESTFGLPLQDLINVSMTQGEQTSVASLQAMSEPGRYRAVFTPIEPGAVTVSLRLQLPENPRYLSGGDVILPLQLERNPQWFIAVGALVLGVVLLVVGLILFTLRRSRLSRHPLRGKVELYIEKEGASRKVWSKDLATYKRNTVLLNRRALNLDRRDTLERLTFLCESEMMYKNKQIRVVAQFKGDNAKPQQRQLSPGGEASFYAPAQEGQMPVVYLVRMPDAMSSLGANNDSSSYFG